jgi:hypothetical protein
VTSPRGMAVVALVAALALPVAGCGKSTPKIPKSDARELVALLRQADARSQAKACTGLAQVTIPELIAKVNGLPPNTDPDIRNTLRDGIDNLRNLAAIKCSTVKPPPPQPTSTETQTQTTPPPSTVTTTTKPPTTKPPTTKPPTTKPPTTAPPSSPSGGAGPGQGKGNGNGNGGGKRQ